MNPIDPILSLLTSARRRSRIPGLAFLALGAALAGRPSRAVETPPPTPAPAASPAPAAPEPNSSKDPGLVEIPAPEQGNDIDLGTPGTGLTVPGAVKAEQARKKERESAIFSAKEAHAANPADPGPVEKLVDLYIEDHDGEQGKKVAEAFVQANPTSTRGLVALGKVLFWLGDFERASLQFQRASSSAPADVVSKVWLARTSSMTGDQAGALSAAEAALALAPADPDALLIRGRVQEAKKDFAGAAKTWERLVAARYDAGVQDTVLLARSQMCAMLAKKQPLAITWPEGGPVTLDTMSFVGVPGLKLRLNQKVEKQFLIDLSAQDIVLTKDTASELQLTGFGGPQLQNNPMVAEYAYPDHAIIDTVQAGPLLLQNVPVGVNPGLRYPDVQIGGLIGRRFLMEFLATIDFPGRKITLAPIPSAPISGDPVSIGNATLIPARYMGTPAGEWLLDSSSFTPGPVSILWAQSHLGMNPMTPGVTPVFRGPYIYMFTMPQIEMGGVTWLSYRATGVDLRTVSERLGVELNGVLPISLLGDTRLTLDLAHNRYHLERVKEQTWKSPSKVAKPAPGSVPAPAPADSATAKPAAPAPPPQ